MSTPPAPARPSLLSFWSDLPREGRMLLSIVVLEFLGSGLVLPFAVVYLHDVRAFSLSTAGLLLGLPPLVGFLVVGPGGALIDRIGARRMLAATLTTMLASDVVLAFATTVPVAAIALVLNGLAFGTSFPAAQTLIASVIPPGMRQRYFGVNFTLLNLGIGLGGLVGGVLVDVHHAWTFQLVYLGDAASYLPGLVLLLGPLRHVAGRPERSRDVPKAGYREVLTKPAVPTLLLLTFVSSFVGYSQLNAGMTAFATSISQVSTRALGFAFAGNTAIIVLLQLVVMQRIEGRRRTRVVAVMGLVWAVSWLLLGLSGMVPGTIAATLLVVACATVFGLGETLLQPTVPAIVNELADDHLRGRFNALNAACFQLPAIIAPPIAGALVGAHLGWVYVALLTAGCLLVGAVSVTRLEPQLTPEVNGQRPQPDASQETILVA
ncbi:MFS transporter [Nocardioides sp. DS6]|uniref:MFS transporter n=1 Tax=Nocardioides eburneus TaxID=3231482 RepID=A0ABV3SUI1_9ACTN